MLALFENYDELMDFYRLNVFQSTMVTLLSDVCLSPLWLVRALLSCTDILSPHLGFVTLGTFGGQISRLAFIPIRHDSLFKTVKVGVCLEQGV